jgi:glycosyltransferase involved in cell wall biosynthesis
MTRVAFVSPEPTPYRAPLLDRVSARPEIELTVIYAARTVAGRTWSVKPRHQAVFLSGWSLPGADRVLRHDYPLTPGVLRALAAARPEAVVVSGWSTFASQAAIGWCRVNGVPYVLLVESHDAGPKSGWRRTVKEAVVPPLLKGAASVLVVGTLARESVVALGADPARVRVFANTIDVPAYEERADRLAARRPELRAEVGLAPGDVAVICVARLVPEKGIATLLRAVAAADDPSLVAVLVGEGPERGHLERIAQHVAARAIFTPARPPTTVAETYVASDVLALLSEHEPWGVVVNEAAACGLPLVLADRVGAARDLLVDGENGLLVPAGDVEAAAAALRRLAADRDLRLRMAARSRAIVRSFGYGPSVEGFVAAVEEATAR